MNKFATTIAFALVAATAAVSAQAAEQTVFDRAQRVEQPGWQRAVAADQNFAAQPEANRVAALWLSALPNPWLTPRP